MVLGDAVSKLETFVWILSHVSRSVTWSLFTLNVSYLVKWSISTWSFMWWCQFIDWLIFETRPSSLLNFGTAYNWCILTNSIALGTWRCFLNSSNRKHRERGRGIYILVPIALFSSLSRRRGACQGPAREEMRKELWGREWRHLAIHVQRLGLGFTFHFFLNGNPGIFLCRLRKTRRSWDKNLTTITQVG